MILVNPFVILFSVITLISVLISGALLLIRRKGGGRWRNQEHISFLGVQFFHHTLRLFHRFCHRDLVVGVFDRQDKRHPGSRVRHDCLPDRQAPA